MIKFLIQKINKEIRHDFAFTLLESVNYNNWYNPASNMRVMFFNTKAEQTDLVFNERYHNYVPIGSVEFVSAFLRQFYNKELKPLNVPEELFGFAGRDILNGNQTSLNETNVGIYFIKSNDKIKGFTEVITIDIKHPINIPNGNYQISEYIIIDSEWRAFIYQNKLVGLQNYLGDFTMFPNINKINGMIKAFKSAPVAYTLDVGISNSDTFVVECNSMTSVGLYGFSNHRILPHMFYRWFYQYVRNIQNKK
jgi:ATP-grasp domain, R2K clade family 2